ncbi:MAG: FAD-dependent oxidoreductase [Myxococcales bacterium]|nr:FAD-dependent oxidoreductase [Myxococcales bacterium]
MTRDSRRGVITDESQLSREVDIAILGGGIQGMTALYECARRGLRAILIERDDFGSGASSHSMRILHGGLRYLQTASLRRSFRSAAERSRLLAIAPQYAEPLRCRLDLTERGAAFRFAFCAGLLANDWLGRAAAAVAGGKVLQQPRYPHWVDGFVPDTEALLFAFMHTALELGDVQLMNHTTCEEIRDRAGGLRGLRIGRHEIAVGRLLRCVGADGASTRVVSANVVVDRLPEQADDEAIGVRHPTDGRYVFAVPWGAFSIIGTWDRPVPEGLGAPPWRDAWLPELLSWLRAAHPRLRGLAVADVRCVQAGFLPAASEGGRPAETGRIARRPDGSLSVCTDKWTTARRLSSLAVRKAARQLGKRQAAGVGDRCLPPLVDREAAIRGFSRQLDGSPSELEARALFGIRVEGARTLADLVLRRLALAHGGVPPPAARTTVCDVAERELSWGQARRDRELQQLASSFEFSASTSAIDR